VRLVGPVLFYDLIRVARRGRFVLLRCLYAGLLLLLMYVVYVFHFASFSATVAQGQAGNQQFMAAFAEKFFGAFLAVQFLAVMLMTPAYTAGAIAEEKQRQTIEYLFASDLANREIIFGKLASRVGNLALFIITGLPILSLTQLFGGITPMLLWCGFGATALAMLSLASLSILQSVYSKRVRDAMVRTYLLVAGYFVGWGLLVLIQLLLTIDPPAPRWVQDIMSGIIRVYNTGNPAYGLYDLVFHVRRTGSFGWQPVVLLGYFALFHGTLALLCMSLSLVKLRSAYIRQVYGKTVKAIKRVQATAVPKKARRLPPIGNHPMIWKEVHAERGLRVGMLGELSFIAIALVCLCPVFVTGGVIVLEWLHRSGALEHNQRTMNLFARWIGTVLTFIISLGVGIRASGCLAAERDRLTHETLMSSTFTNGEIYFAKWLGAMLSMRWFSILLISILLMAALTGGVFIAAFPVLLLSVVVNAALAAGLGMWFGSSSRSGLRAATWTMVWLLGINLFGLLFAQMADSVSPHLNHLRATSPIGVHYTLGFSWADFEQALHPNPANEYLRGRPATAAMMEAESLTFFLSFLGLALHGLAATLLGFSGLRKFARGCGRIYGQPRREPIVAHPRIHT
jgi:ABC-type transport system involved in multi-copper enzyme maturation permease subunit